MSRKARRRGLKGRYRQKLNDSIAAIPGPTAYFDEKARLQITLPAELELSGRQASCLGTFEVLHKVVSLRRRHPLRIAFTKLRHICPESCLILAAEIYLWKLRSKSRLRVLEDEWDPVVLELLRDMGYFELLELPDPDLVSVARNIRFLKFRTGSLVSGEDARKLRLDLEAVVQSKIPKNQLYDGLTEAITNTVHHAYPNEGANRWWISGSYDSATSELCVMCLDRGVGIPATLPKSSKWEKIQSVLGSAGLLSDHGHLIKAAITTRRSGTGKPHRGRGLGQFFEFTDEFSDSRLQIVSGRGRYLRVRRNSRPETEKVFTLPREFAGTLISWRAKIDHE